MDVLTIDIGSYSIKMAEFSIQKKYSKLLRQEEFIVPEALSEEETESRLVQRQLDIVVRNIGKFLKSQTVLIINIPTVFMTSRFVTLPLKNKKKAEQMIPFQIEEDIPFPLSEVHYASAIYGDKNKVDAFVSIIKRADFQIFYDFLDQNRIKPRHFSTEGFFYQSFVRNENLEGSFCILDIGHDLTKAYFFHEGKMVNMQTSYTAGRAINEMIARRYRISMTEAIKYKHNYAYFLVEEQYDEVTREQKEFALYMKELFATLCDHFKRWVLSLKVQHNINISHVYLTGGSCHLSNINAFLTREFALPCSLLDTFEQSMQKGVSLSPGQKLSFNQTHIQSKAILNRGFMQNFLVAPFNLKSVIDIPLESAAFVFNRVLILCVLSSIFLLTQNFILGNYEQKINKELRALMKTPRLSLSNTIKRNAQRKPQVALKTIKKKKKELQEVIKRAQDVFERNDLLGIKKIQEIFPQKQPYSLLELNVVAKNLNAIVEYQDEESLAKLKQQLQKIYHLEEGDFKVFTNKKEVSFNLGL